MPATVEFYFTLTSPWTFLGWDRFHEVCREHAAEVAYRPADFTVIFPATGGLPLGQRPKPRRSYRMAELRRWSRFLGIRINTEPRFFPVSSDPASRMVIAAMLERHDPAALARAVLAACWQDERDISNPATLRAIADEAGYDGLDLLARAGQPEVQSAYDTFTEEALAREVFGAPSFVVDGEVFWGQDRIEFLARKLAGTD